MAFVIFSPFWYIVSLNYLATLMCGSLFGKYKFILIVQEGNLDDFFVFVCFQRINCPLLEILKEQKH
jgi:hypothetical protein